MTDSLTAHSAFKVLAALADLGEATAAAVAAHTRMAYSTVTPKLRAWEASGHAERFRSDANQTLWRLTASGRVTTATSGPADAEAPAPVDRAVAVHRRLSDGTEQETVNESADADDADDHTDCEQLPMSPVDPVAAEPVPQPDRGAGPHDATEQHDDPAGAPEPAGPDPAPDAAGDATSGEPAARGAAPTGRDAAAGDPGPSSSGRAPSAGRPGSTGASSRKRPAGALGAAILDILKANPDSGFKTGELCKLIDLANEGTDAKKASAGAVANAAYKLVQAGQAVLRNDKPAVFGLSRTNA